MPKRADPNVGDPGRKRVHFIAVGGAAMHSLAIALAALGWRVTGSDDRIVDPSRSRLAKWNLLPPAEGWDPARVTKDLDAVILGMHARKDNPELARAEELELAIFSFPEFLYRQTREKTRVVVGGSHGKTTITSMVMHVLRWVGKDSDYMVGAEVAGFDNMVRLSASAGVAVFEGDEYPASPLDPRPKFHLYKPHIGLISGIAWDHINVFPTPEDYHKQFERFVTCIEAGGCLIFNQEDRAVRELAVSTSPQLRKVPYSMHPHRVENAEYHLLTPFGVTALQIFGKHNMENVAAALAVCRELGIAPREFYTAVADFKGAARRLETLHQDRSCTVFRDFAHAPSKVSATTRAVRDLYPSRRLIACLELHTFSSLNREFLQQYRGSLDFADVAAVYFDPETLRQKKLASLSREHIHRAFRHGELVVIDSLQALHEFLEKLDITDSNLLLMSSGTFSGLDCKKLTESLTARARQSRR